MPVYFSEPSDFLSNPFTTPQISLKEFCPHFLRSYSNATSLKKKKKNLLLVPLWDLNPSSVPAAKLTWHLACPAFLGLIHAGFCLIPHPLHHHHKVKTQKILQKKNNEARKKRGQVRRPPMHTSPAMTLSPSIDLLFSPVSPSEFRSLRTMTLCCSTIPFSQFAHTNYWMHAWMDGWLCRVSCR